MSQKSHFEKFQIEKKKGYIYDCPRSNGFEKIPTNNNVRTSGFQKTPSAAVEKY